MAVGTGAQGARVERHRGERRLDRLLESAEHVPIEWLDEMGATRREIQGVEVVVAQFSNRSGVQVAAQLVREQVAMHTRVLCAVYFGKFAQNRTVRLGIEESSRRNDEEVPPRVFGLALGLAESASRVDDGDIELRIADVATRSLEHDAHCVALARSRHKWQHSHRSGIQSCYGVVVGRSKAREGRYACLAVTALRHAALIEIDQRMGQDWEALERRLELVAEIVHAASEVHTGARFGERPGLGVLK